MYARSSYWPANGNQPTGRWVDQFIQMQRVNIIFSSTFCWNSCKINYIITDWISIQTYVKIGYFPTSEAEAYLFKRISCVIYGKIKKKKNFKQRIFVTVIYLPPDNEELHHKSVKTLHCNQWKFHFSKTISENLENVCVSINWQWSHYGFRLML